MTGGVATDGCPKENVIKVGMIQVDRSFPIEITVTDAQYVYKELPSGLEPGQWWGVPFFQNAIPEDTYVGITNLRGGRQFNSACYEHYKAEPAEPEEPEEPTESDTGDETDAGDITDNTSETVAPDPDNEKFEDETGGVSDSTTDTTAETTDTDNNSEHTESEAETAPPWLGL